MLTVYRVTADPEFQSLAPADVDVLLENSGTIWRFDGKPIASQWSAPEVYVQYPRLPAPDIWAAILGDNFAYEDHAAAVLQSFLDQSGEQLPLIYEERRLIFLNVTYVLNCLDAKNSEHRPGLPHVITKYAFHKRRLEYPLFKIPETQAGELLTVEGTNDPDHDFKPLVEKHGLKGLNFTKLWSDE